MDSLSQAALGACVAVACTRGEQPKRAIIYGALLGTLPDLDVLVSYSNDLAATIHHRTWSHSWLVQSAVALPLAWLLSRFEKQFSFRQLCWIVWLCLISHSALDAMTLYGTDLLWPLSRETVVIGSIFIIDPLYTLALLWFIIHAWRNPDKQHLWHKSILALVISSCYLVWGWSQQQRMEKLAWRELQPVLSTEARIIATPAPLTSLMWRIIVVDGNTHYESIRSIFDKQPNLQFKRYSRNHELLARLPDTNHYRQLLTFSHGYARLDIVDDDVIMRDLRMGIDPFYVFNFHIADVLKDVGTTANNSQETTTQAPSTTPVEPAQFQARTPTAVDSGGAVAQVEFPAHVFIELLQRIFDENKQITALQNYQAGDQLQALDTADLHHRSPAQGSQ